MRALIVSPIFPEPVNSGGATRIRNLIRCVGEHHEVHCIAFKQPFQNGVSGELPGLAALATLVPIKVNTSLRDRVTDSLAPGQWGRTIRRAAERRRGMPRAAIQALHPPLERALVDAVRRYDYDVVQLEFTEFGRYHALIREHAPDTAIVLEEIDVAYVAIERLRDSTHDAEARRFLDEEARRLRKFEHALWPKCDAIVTMSEDDRDYIASHGTPKDRIWTVPNGVDTEFFTYAPPAGGARVLFVGYFRHPPNVTGLRYFLDEVWPTVRQRNPDITLDVVGAEAPDDLLAHDGANGITFHGFVDDVREVMRQCRATIVPIRNGGGTRLKVVEAFAMGLPVVSTTLGCEGLRVNPGEHALIADTGEGLAAALCDVVESDERAQSLSRNARALVEQAFTWPSIGARLEKVWHHVGRN